MARPVADADRVAVRGGVDDAAGCDRAAGAGHVLDHDGLAKDFSHRFAQNTRQRIGRSAGRKSDHQADWM